MDATELKMGLFGYSRKRVDALLTERDVQMVQSVQDVRVAADRVGELASELETARRAASEQGALLERAEARSEQLSTELDEARAGRRDSDRRVAELEVTVATLGVELADATEHARLLEESGSLQEGSAVTVEGMQQVLEATRHGVAELLDGALRSADQEMRQTERTHSDLRDEVDRLADWRDRLMPLTEVVRRSLDEAHAQTAALAGVLSELERTAAQPTDAAREDWPVITLVDAAEDGNGKIDEAQQGADAGPRYS